jgi:hypothetical protein
MFTKLKQKVKETTLDTAAPAISSNKNSTKSAYPKDSSSEAANNSSSEDGNLSSKIFLNETDKKVFDQTKSIDIDTSSKLNKQFSRTESISSQQDQLSASFSFLNVNNKAEQLDSQLNSNQTNYESNFKFELKKLNESLLKQVEDLSVI